MADPVVPEDSIHVRAKKSNPSSGTRAVDITGQKFGRLTVVSRAPNLINTSGKTQSVWNCKCECGETKVSTGNYLRTGRVKSCGCLKPKSSQAIKYKYHVSPEYNSWKGAKSRVTNKNNKRYPDYGGRGITMSPEWLNSYEAFIADMGPRPPGTSLDRIDNDGLYCAENCHWADKYEQANNRRSTKLYRVRGEERTLGEWSKISGIAEPRIWKRINICGWEPERAIFAPLTSRWGYLKK